MLIRHLRRHGDIEKLLYRFFTSIIFGFGLGIYMYHPFTSKGFDNTQVMGCRNNDIRSLENASKLIYIGMMSTGERLHTRASAAILTWAKHHPNVHVEIFAKPDGAKDNQPNIATAVLDNNVRVIHLPGIRDNAYPSQKKSFSMIKYMYDTHIDSFDWFVRLDDDAYLDMDKLHTLLARANATKRVFMGNPGYGKDKLDYISKDENYCMGGSGIVMSRELLRHLGPGLKQCLLSLFTEHEDVELGRCVRKLTGVKCTENWETMRTFFQNFKGKTYGDNIKTLQPETIDDGVIFHANKDPLYQINFHTLVLKRRIAWAIDRITKLEKDIHKLPLEHEEPFSKFPVQWNAIIGHLIFKGDQINLIRPMTANLKNTLSEGTNKYLRVLKFALKARGEFVSSEKPIETYQSTDPTDGFYAFTHMRFKVGKYRDKRKSQRQTVMLKRSFPQHWAFWEEPHVLSVRENNLKVRHSLLQYRKEPAVNFLMALSGRPSNFIRFVQNFESTFLSREENVNLYVAYFPPITDSPTNLSQDEQFIHDSLKTVRETYPNSKLEIISLEPGTAFSRGLGLQMAADHLDNGDELLFFCDVDLIFSPEMLIHIRRNTIQGTQVYYPTFFSQYDPKIVYAQREKPESNFSIGENDGFWRHYSYGMVAIYKSDFARTKGFDLSIVGWGSEDVFLADSILKTAGLHVFKSVEPAEIHIYHDKHCDSSLKEKQYIDCVRSKVNHNGPAISLLRRWEISSITNLKPPPSKRFTFSKRSRIFRDKH